jgi:hypothetical protein
VRALAASAAGVTPGTVVAWGDDSYGQTNVPAGLSSVVAIAAGTYHSLALISPTAVTLGAQSQT